MVMHAPPSNGAPASCFGTHFLAVFVAGVHTPWVHITAGQLVLHASHDGSEQVNPSDDVHALPTAAPLSISL
jgi:hypothetical protein